MCNIIISVNSKFRDLFRYAVGDPGIVGRLLLSIITVVNEQIHYDGYGDIADLRDYDVPEGQYNLLKELIGRLPSIQKVKRIYDEAEAIYVINCEYTAFEKDAGLFPLIKVWSVPFEANRGRTPESILKGKLRRMKVSVVIDMKEYRTLED